MMKFLNWYAQRKMEQYINNTFGDAFRAAEGFADSASQQHAESSSRHRPRRREKRIDPADGEYIEFEEISTTRETAESADGSSSSFSAESQIVDAEWEEVTE